MPAFKIRVGRYCRENIRDCARRRAAKLCALILHSEPRQPTKLSNSVTNKNNRNGNILDMIQYPRSLTVLSRDQPANAVKGQGADLEFWIIRPWDYVVPSRHLADKEKSQILQSRR